MPDLPFGSITDKLNARFALGLLLPALTFSLLSVVALAAGHGFIASLHWWDGQPASAQAFLVTVFIAAVMLASWVAAGQTPWLLRVASGYWPAALKRNSLYSLGRRRHQRQYFRLAESALSDPAAIERLYLYYPNRYSDILPTRLGNVLAAVEAYARTRYGMDLVLVWPRLFAVLPDRHTAAIAAARAELETQLATATLAAVSGVGVAIPLALIGSPVALPVGWLWGCLAIGYAAYQAAVSSAVSYGQEMRTAFDLHRKDLLDTLGLAGNPEERDTWRRLQEFWFQGIPLDAARPAPLQSQEDAPDTGPSVPLGAIAVAAVGALTIILVLLR